MRFLIKKIDLFILRKFLALFAGSFLVSVFVLVMQFLWRSVDDLVGKGMSMDIFIKSLWYACITMVPQAMPLAILLAALITFGNMGQDLELTAMKAAGIPLRRIMAPVLAAVAVLAGVSFVFQNDASPQAQKEVVRMMATMKVSSPAIEIPEGVYYSGIPDVNLYVERKNAATGMLYNVTIYKVDGGIENAQIVVADSARLETTADKNFLKLSIYDGEQFENLQSTGTNGMMSRSNVPYDRETFKFKTLLIDFDSNFELMEAEQFSGMARVKNLRELEIGYDSIIHYCDSVGRTYYDDVVMRYLFLGSITHDDTLATRQLATLPKNHPDTLFAAQSNEQMVQALQEAKRKAGYMLTDLEWQQPITKEAYKNARRHLIEWHQKFSYTIACIIFLLIGAPLGAIIRKGGLGVPVILGVIIYLVYYLISTSGMKMTREGALEAFFGMWISTLVLAPLGIWITYKANGDSAVFNADAYAAFFRRLLGIHPKRFVPLKEVVVDVPDYEAERQEAVALGALCREYIATERLAHAPGYIKLFFGTPGENRLLALSDRMENLIERLSNSRNLGINYALNQFPMLFTTAHRLSRHHWLNAALGVLLPVGLVCWGRTWRFRVMNYRRLKQVQVCCAEVEQRITAYLAAGGNGDE